MSALFAQHNKIDSLKKIVSTGKNDTTKINAAITLAWQVLFSNPDSSLFYNNSALALINKNDRQDKEWKQIAKGKTFYQMLVCYYRKGDFDKALEYSEKSMGIWEDLEKEPRVKKIISVLKANCLSTTANCHILLGEYPVALKYLFQSLSLREDASTFCSVGVVYDRQGDNEKAMEYYFKALALDEKNNNKVGMARDLGNIGSAYMNVDSLDKSLEYCTKALKIDEELGNKEGYVRHLSNIAGIYFYKENYPLALDHYSKAFKTHNEMQNVNEAGMALGNIGNTYLKMDKPALARKYLAQAVRMSKETGDKYSTLNWLLYLSITDSILGNFKESYNDYKEYILYRDSVNNEDNTREQTKLEMQFEFDKKEAATKAEQEKKDAVEAEEKRKQKIITWVIIAGVILVAMFALFVFRAFRQKQKANIEISIQKMIIEEKQKEIVDSIYYARRIQQSLLPTEKYITRIIQKLKS